MLHRTALKVLSALAIAPLWTVASLDRSLAQETAPWLLADSGTRISAGLKVNLVLETAPRVLTDLPGNTAAVITIDTSASKWAEFNRFQLIPELQSLAQLFFGFAAPPAALETLEPLKEVVAWLGEDKAAIVLMPTNGSKDLSLDSNFVFLIPVKDAQRFDEFLAMLQEKDERKLVERQYKGVSIFELPALPPEEPTEETPEEPTEDAPATPTTPNLPTTQRLLQQTTVQRLLRPDIFTVYQRLFYPAGLASRSILAFQAPALEAKPSPQPSDSPRPLPSPEPTSPPNLGPDEKVPAEEPTEAPEGPELVLTKLPGYIAFSNMARPVEQLVDAQEQSSRLVYNVQFQKTLSHPKFSASLLSVYINLPEFIQFSDFFLSAEDLPGEAPVPLPTRDEVEKQLKTVTDEYSAIDGFFWLEPEGLRTQTNTYFQASKPERAVVATPAQDRILARIPAITYLVGTGRNLKRDWADIVKQLESETELKDGLREFRNAAKLNIGLDIDRDLIPWMDGEYALFLYPSRQSFFNLLMPNLNLGTGVMLQTSNRQAAEVALQRLNKFVRVKSNGEVKIENRQLGGIPVTSWEAKDGERVHSLLAYSWVDNDTLVLTTGIGSMADLVPKPWQSIDQDYTFKTATATFDRPNDGYFYINFGASLSWIYSLFPYEGFPGIAEAKKIIGTFRSISASAVTTAYKEQFDSLIVLAPVRPNKSAEPAAEEPGSAGPAAEEPAAAEPDSEQPKP